ncbi:MAG: hypothetical protein Q8N99_08365 [Nanoarchaeota archaeon]|nr:hypothetical protein [Nanoarchaeota archaeon]
MAKKHKPAKKAPNISHYIGIAIMLLGILFGTFGFYKGKIEYMQLCNIFISSIILGGIFLIISNLDYKRWHGYNKGILISTILYLIFYLSANLFLIFTLATISFKLTFLFAFITGLLFYILLIPGTIIWYIFGLGKNIYADYLIAFISFLFYILVGAVIGHFFIKDLGKKANSNIYVGESNGQLFRSCEKKHFYFITKIHKCFFSSSPKPPKSKTQGFGDKKIRIIKNPHHNKLRSIKSIWSNK